ncbi:MAG TPA: acyltransferase family protein [Solirubrobacterales bacterium]|jgi:peptidoglycan/LPS O-acetylase OafA/YrhL|nr:acyltransferase family protein [Solirubrobacterales bacterium]
MQAEMATASQQRGTSDRFRPDIEGLRAVAIVAVLLCHAGLASFAGGYVGVDVFFVISGYLITRLLLGELDHTGTASLPRFYARRIRRLLPLSALLLATVAALSFAIFSPVRAGEVAHDIVACATWTANWHFAAQSVDYFAQGTEPSPVQHLWSLSIEEQFYVVWPGLLLAVTWAWRRRGRSPRLVLCVLLAAILAASFAYNLHVTSAEPAAAYFSTFGRAWELALGAALAVLGDVRLRRPAAIVLGWVGLAAIVWAVLAFGSETPFPGTAALLPTLGCAALILAGSAADGVDRAGPAGLLSLPPCRYVGRISYAWYLWHWPALIFAAALWGPLSPAAGLAVVAASWVPTALSHRLVEEPFRHARRLVAKPSLALALGLACTAIAVVSSVLLVDLQVTEKTAPISAVKGAAALRHEKVPEENAAALRPNPLKAYADRGRLYADGCLVGIQGTNSDRCLYGDPHGHRTLFLFGDSHAMQYFPPLEKVAVRNHWRLIALTKAECTPAEIEVRSMIADREYSQCDVWRRGALERIETAARSTTVVIAGDTAYTPYGPDGEELHGRAAAAAMEEGLLATLRRLHGRGLRTVVMTDTPAAPDEIPACISEHLHEFGACAFRQHRGPDVTFERRAARRAPGSHLVDLTPEICPQHLCRAVIGNALTYRDDSHLTATFARTLSPWLERGLEAAGLP